jgi:hypothetical protein
VFSFIEEVKTCIFESDKKETMKALLPISLYRLLFCRQSYQVRMDLISSEIDKFGRSPAGRAFRCNLFADRGKKDFRFNP